MTYSSLENPRKFKSLPSDKQYGKAESEKDLGWKMSNSNLSPSVEKKPTIIIYGGPGSGKTKNSLSIATYFGLKRVIDPWSITDDFPEEDALLVSNEPYSKLCKISSNIFSIEEAIHIVRPRR